MNELYFPDKPAKHARAQAICVRARTALDCLNVCRDLRLALLQLRQYRGVVVHYDFLRLCEHNDTKSSNLSEVEHELLCWHAKYVMSLMLQHRPLGSWRA